MEGVLGSEGEGGSRGRGGDEDRMMGDGIIGNGMDGVGLVWFLLVYRCGGGCCCCCWCCW